MRTTIEERKINGQQFRILNFSSIGGADVPLYKETASTSGWIDYGDWNNLPNYYIGLMARSPKHNAILKGKAQMIAGNGIDRRNLTNEALQFIKNPYGEIDLEEICARSAYDMEVFGAYAWNIIWSKDRTKVASINYVSPQQLRIANPDLTKPNEAESYFICKDWENTNKFKPVKYPGFSLVNRNDASQILYVKEYRPGRYFYGEPEYMSAVRWIEMEYEISNFHLNNLKNGFAPSMMINFVNEIPSDEEMDFLMRRTEEQYKGAQGAGKVIFTFSKDKDSAPVITPIQLNNSDDRFIQLNKEIAEGIYTGHRVVNPEIFGSSKEGQVNFGQTDLLNSLEMFNSLYVRPKQRIIEKELMSLAKINGIVDELRLTEYRVEFSKMDISIGDILSILQSPITAEQKFEILTSSGYDEESAKKLCGLQN